MSVKKEVTRRNLFILFAIIASLYFSTRLYELANLPIFFDEANYIFWAKRIATGNAGWFLSLSAGKPVPFIWLIALLLKILPSHAYLFAGRLPSVFFGAITLVGTYKLGSHQFGRRVGLVTAVLYALSPFALFYERMALYDSMLAAMLVWTSYFVFKTASTRRLRGAIFWGVFLGGALLTKASALSYVLLTPIVYLFLGQFRRIRLIFVAILVSQVVANAQIVSSGYLEYVRKSLDYTPGAKSLSATRDIFFPNLLLSWSWLAEYFTYPIFLASLFSLLFLIWKRPRIGLAFFTLGVVPIIAFSFLGRIYFPRYLLFTLPFFLISLAYCLDILTRRARFVLLLSLPLLLYLPIKFDWFLITSPHKASFPQIDRYQYVSGYPSGYGLEEMYQFVRNKSRQGPVRLVVQGSFSQFPNAFFLEFWDIQNVWIEERWPLTKQDIDEGNGITARGLELQPFLLKRPPLPKTFIRTYFVVHNDEKGGIRDVTRKYGLRSVVEGKKPGGKDSVYLTESYLPIRL